MSPWAYAHDAGPRAPRASGSSPPDAPPPGGTPDGDLDVRTKPKPLHKVPRRFKVIFHNDDYTTMHFVVDVLVRFFHKNETEATHIMLTVHKKGSAVAGLYPKDVAETKTQQVMDFARESGMPLLLTTEPE